MPSQAAQSRICETHLEKWTSVCKYRNREQYGRHDCLQEDSVKNSPFHIENQGASEIPDCCQTLHSVRRAVQRKTPYRRVKGGYYGIGLDSPVNCRRRPLVSRLAYSPRRAGANGRSRRLKSGAISWNSFMKWKFIPRKSDFIQKINVKRQKWTTFVKTTKCRFYKIIVTMLDETRRCRHVPAAFFIKRVSKKFWNALDKRPSLW